MPTSSRIEAISRRRFMHLTLTALLAGLLAFAPAPSHAQAWPTRQAIRVIVPLTPGSAIDIVARLVFEQVGRQIGQELAHTHLL